MSSTPGEPVDIRDAIGEDADAIAATHIACWQEAYADQLPAEFLGNLPTTFERRRDFWRGIADAPQPQEALLVAELGGKVVGFAHVCACRDPSSDETTGEVTAIYLRKAYWGRGIGRALLTKAVERLRALGFARATLWVLDSNKRTRGFYEAADWKMDGAEKEDQVGGLTLREVRYRTEL